MLANPKHRTSLLATKTRKCLPCAQTFRSLKKGSDSPGSRAWFYVRCLTSQQVTLSLTAVPTSLPAIEPTLPRPIGSGVVTGADAFELALKFEALMDPERPPSRILTSPDEETRNLPLCHHH